MVKEIQVADEVAAIGDAVKALVLDIKAKKEVAVIVADVLPKLMTAVSAFQALGADLKKVDNQVYLVKCLAEAFEPAVA